MGRVRTKTTKRAARLVVEKYYPKLTLDFPTNKRICSEVAQIPSKRLRNKIAGYVTHLMKRIERGPVRGISLKLQEEEREKRENYVPSVSIMVEKTANIELDSETKKLLEVMGFTELAKTGVAEGQQTSRNQQSYSRSQAFGKSQAFKRNQKPRRTREKGDDEDLPSGRNPHARKGGRPTETTETTETPETVVANVL